MQKKGSVVSALLPALIVPIAVIVMVMVFGYFDSSVDHASLTTDASDAINDTADQAYNAFNLASILPIVVIAGIMISILIGAFVIKGL